MIAKAKKRWQTILDHPILRLELRRIRRRRWWPGRRFFLFYPVLMGTVFGCGVALALAALLDRFSIPVTAWEVQLAALVTGLPTVCLVGTVSSLLAFGLSWIAPALTAGTIARERELATFDLLRATLLTERAIVLGKLAGCIAQLWPGILVLALLTPFQLIMVTGSGFLPLPYFLGPLMMSPLGGVEWSWMWVLVAGVVALLRPWGHLALHTTIGLFISTLLRSSGLAVAASYGTIIVVRVALYLLTTILNAALMVVPGIMLDASGAVTDDMFMTGMLVIPSLTALGVAVFEFVGAALLVWGSIWWLKRT
jgi:hypothetical protein